jgi:hypothetical protein
MKGGKSIIELNKFVTLILKYNIAIGTSPTGEGASCKAFPLWGKRERGLNEIKWKDLEINIIKSMLFCF